MTTNNKAKGALAKAELIHSINQKKIVTSVQRDLKRKKIYIEKEVVVTIVSLVYNYFRKNFKFSRKKV